MSGIPAETLLLCLMCGVLLGFVFAVLEFLRLLFSLGKIAAAVTDVLFCLFAAVATFLLSLAVSAGHACTALETEFLQNTRKDGGKRWKHC